MKRLSLAVLLAFLVVGSWGSVQAQYSSSQYQTNEVLFGTGGDVDVTSPNYRANASTGSLGVGGVSSTNYYGFAGFLTPSDVFLEMIVTGATVDLSDLSDSSTSSGAAQAGVCNCSFTVRTYLASSYVVQTISNPPTNGNGDVLTAKSTLGAPSGSTSVEEFGINLVDNSSPNIGSNPSNEPDSTFANGQAASGYSTADQFKYAVNDVIASAPATAGSLAFGQTNYTISYIAKRKTLSKAGTYIMNHELVATPTY